MPKQEKILNNYKSITILQIMSRHGLSCEKAALSRNARHNNANSLIQKALTSAEFAAISEPRKDRPDGMTTYPFKEGKPFALAWGLHMRGLHISL